MWLLVSCVWFVVCGGVLLGVWCLFFVVRRCVLSIVRCSLFVVRSVSPVVR